MNNDITMSYSKEWWDEFEQVLASQTIPCVEYIPPLEQPKPPVLVTQNILTEGGNMYYTLIDDCQFAVTADHPQAKGWSNG